MAEEYIEKDLLLQKLTTINSAVEQGIKYYGAVYQAVQSISKANVKKAKYGKWVEHSPDVAAMRAFHKLGIGRGMSENSIFYTCSCCDSFGSLYQNYCFNCGAEMKLQ